MTTSRAYRAGAAIEDYCRACKADRMHTVIAVDSGGVPLRASCGFCRSDHNYRGGPRTSTGGSSVAAAPTRESPAAASRTPLPLVSERERTADPIMVPGHEGDLETMLRRVIREETGLSAVTPAEKWRGGTLALRPGREGLQEKSWPIETFFHKIVMLRNRLRSLEQQVNASDLPDDQKVKLQGYVTGCYSSLTSFNVLFADEGDQFKGGGGAGLD
jgi:hypothetical protein